MKTLGILGGMGSMATVDFFSKIVSNTDAKSDQEHLHIIIENCSDIPDRTSYLLNSGINPLPKMIEGAKRLELIGADMITMPCNTAHYFYDELQSNISIPIIHIIEETAKFLKEKSQKCLLLATEGTYQVNLYKNIFNEYQMTVIYPNKYLQLELDNLIYTFKNTGTFDEEVKLSVLKKITGMEIDHIVLGCTELPIIFSDQSFIDPTLILARSAIQLSGGKVKS